MAVLKRALEFVEGELAWGKRGRLAPAHRRMAFRGDPLKWVLLIEVRVRVFNENYLKVKASELDAETTWQRIAPEEGEGFAPVDAATAGELREMRDELIEELATLRGELQKAYAEYGAAYAEANPFANLRLAERTTPKLSDLYNGTIIDGRYRSEPVIQLSPASPRYGEIGNRLEKWHRESAGLAAEIGNTASRLETVASRLKAEE